MKTNKTYAVILTMIFGLTFQACGREEVNFRGSASAEIKEKRKHKEEKKRDNMDQTAIELFASCTGIETDDVETDVEFVSEEAADFCVDADKIALANGLDEEATEIDVDSI